MTSYVLLVEDETLVRRALLKWLAALGYDGRAVATAAEALETIKRRLPSVVVTDLVLPTHDGIWLLQRIRIYWPTLPVILSSGSLLSEETIDRARRLGIVDVLEKPFRRHTLHQLLQRAINQTLQSDTEPLSDDYRKH